MQQIFREQLKVDNILIMQIILERVVVLVFLMTTTVFSALTVDIFNSSTIAVYHCVKQSGFSRAHVQVQNKTVQIHPNAVQMLTNIKNAGIELDISILVCRNRTIQQIVPPFVNGIPKELYKLLWIQIYANYTDTNCTWFFVNKSDNCLFLKSIINEFKKYNINVGVHIQLQFWSAVFNGTTSCPLDSNIPLAYTHIDHLPSFEDFTPIGGWNKPTRKRYEKSNNLCGIYVGYNYQP